MKTCRKCIGDLNARATVTLYDIELDKGAVVGYQGGPPPQSEEDVLEMVSDCNPTITCVNGHVVDPLA